MRPFYCTLYCAPWFNSAGRTCCLLHKNNVLMGEKYSTMFFMSLAFVLLLSPVALCPY